jgi:hypothetical protein
MMMMTKKVMSKRETMSKVPWIRKLMKKMPKRSNHRRRTKPVLLTKSGRPRKKPGRKPGSGKKKHLQLLQQQQQQLQESQEEEE